MPSKETKKWMLKILFDTASEVEQCLCEVSAIIAGRKEVNESDIHNHISGAGDRPPPVRPVR